MSKGCYMTMKLLEAVRVVGLVGNNQSQKVNYISY